MNSNRINISEKVGSTSIIILSQKDKKKQGILLSWIVLWSLGGLVVLTQLFGKTNSEEKIFLSVWIAFWIYFEFITCHAYLWRRFGFERLLIEGDKFYYRREIKNKGKSHSYDCSSIKKIELIDDSSENSFLKNLRESYWIIGGEALSIEVNGKAVKLGLQLEKQDVLKLHKLLLKKIQTK